MNFSAAIMPEALLSAGFVILAVCLLMAVVKAPWFRLKNVADANIYFAAILAIWLFWRGSAGINPGMEYHLLMTTSLTLMFGWAFAIIAVSIAQLILTLEGGADLSGYGLNVLFNGIIPIVFIYWFYRLIYQYLPRNFFIYIFLVTFAGGALSMLLSRALGLGLLILSDAYSLNNLGDDPWFILVMLFPEGFVNGMIMTLLVVYRPQWVSSFDDREYLLGK